MIRSIRRHSLPPRSTPPGGSADATSARRGFSLLSVVLTGALVGLLLVVAFFSLSDVFKEGQSKADLRDQAVLNEALELFKFRNPSSAILQGSHDLANHTALIAAIQALPDSPLKNYAIDASAITSSGTGAGYIITSYTSGTASLVSYSAPAGDVVPPAAGATNEVVMNGFGITSLSGGSSSSALTGVPTAAMASGRRILVGITGQQMVYELVDGSDPQVLPDVVRPADFGGGNQKIWRLRGMYNTLAADQNLADLSNKSAARAALNLQSMALQSANAVSISGGSATLSSGGLAVGTQIATSDGKVTVAGGTDGVLKSTFQVTRNGSSFGAGFSLLGTREYSLISTDVNSPLGAGKLLLADSTAGATRMVMTPSGLFGFGGSFLPDSTVTVKGSLGGTAFKILSDAGAELFSVKNDGTIAGLSIGDNFVQKTGDTMTGPLVIDRGSGALPPEVNAGATSIRTADARIIESINWGNTGVTLLGRASGGTRGSPSPTANGQGLWSIQGWGYENGAYSAAGRASYNAIADGLWSATNAGAYHVWSGTPNGSTASAEWMRLQNGNLGLGTIAVPKMRADLYGTSGLPATTGIAPKGSLRLHASNNAVLDMGVDHASAMGWIQSSDQADLSLEYGLILNPNGGKVGVGRVPGATLDVNGTLNVGTSISLADAPSYFAEGYGWRYWGDSQHPLQLLGNSALTIGYAASGGTYGTSGLFAAGSSAIGSATATERLTIVDSVNTNGDSGVFAAYAQNQTQGVAIGYSGISKVGSNADGDLRINAKGTGNLILQNNTLGATIASGNFYAKKYVIQDSVDGGSAKGIWMWNAGDPNWGIYMGTAGASKSLAAGTATAGNDFASHAIRFRVNSNAASGFIFENAAEQNLLSINGSTGNTYIRGNLTLGGTLPWSSISGRPAISGTWNWSGQGGQPTWLWGSNDGSNMNVWNPSNFVVSNVTALAGTWTGANMFKSNKGAGSYLGTQHSYGLQVFADDGGAAAMSFHRGGSYAVNMGLDPDNVLRIGGWSAGANRWTLDMGGNQTLVGSLQVGSGQNSSDIYMYDGDHGTRRIHNNGDRIGFFTQDGGWGSWCDDVGNWESAGWLTGLHVRSRGNFYTDQNFGYGVIGVYASDRYQGVFAMGDAYKLAADGTTSGNLYGIAWTHTNVGGQSKAGLGHQMLVMENGVTQTAIGNGIWTRANITVSGNNVTGGGIILADDGDIVDLNDGYASMRFSYGVRVYSARSGGSVAVTLGGNGQVTAGSFNATSARRFKDEVTALSSEEQLEKVLKLQPVSWEWKPGQSRTGHDIGLIADDVEKQFPEIVGKDETGQVTGLDYSRLVAPLIASVKVLSAENDALRSRVEKTESRIESLERRGSSNGVTPLNLALAVAAALGIGMAVSRRR